MCRGALPQLPVLSGPAHRQGLQGGHLRADRGPGPGQGAGEPGHRPHRHPGTVIDDSMLSPGQSNYICAVAVDETGAGVCFCDISTGEAEATSFEGP